MAPRHQQGDPATTFVRFFKIICHWHIRDEKIKLPMEFTKKCGLKLPNPVILKVIYGSKKKVHWTKINGSIWFIGKEWKEFLEHYSVSHGHLFLFKYCLVASYFEVQIFDNTTLEIDYPHPDEPHYDDDDDVKVHKYDEYQWKGVSKYDEDTSESSAAVDARRRDSPPERKSNNPSFEEGDYLLKVENGRIWKVMFKTWCGYAMPYNKYKLQKGWAKFSQGNKLDKNDVCVNLSSFPTPPCQPLMFSFTVTTVVDYAN
ncbi:hypothetical protein PIB30_023106 [Stylosanthes scabra]|uniref:TF-B3 domain-containing protein n=1 Tax=Stylosanthes scabra TaxID=79078 RepID=A0ABU6Z6W6_9FABA|nr:hypothetical protein [Stylosanthes scabra]